MTEIEVEQLLRDFVYHVVDKDIAVRMTVMRKQYYHLATHVLLHLPDCRERSLALTHLEDSCMRALQVLAIQGTPIPIGQYHDGNSAKLEERLE